MRAMPIAVTALAAALLLTACNDTDKGDKGDKNQEGRESTACRIDRLGMEVGPANTAPAAGDTGNIPVSLTNQSTPCTLDGFPGVFLEAGGDSVTVPATEGGKAQKLSLAKGASASFTLTYVRGAAGGEDSLGVRTLKIGLPGSDATRSFPWTYGPVAAKGTPDVSVSAFQQAGD